MTVESSTDSTGFAMFRYSFAHAVPIEVVLDVLLDVLFGLLVTKVARTGMPYIKYLCL